MCEISHGDFDRFPSVCVPTYDDQVGNALLPTTDEATHTARERTNALHPPL